MGWFILAIAVTAFGIGLKLGLWHARDEAGELYMLGQELGIVEGRRQITALRRSAEMRGRRARI